jgi:hypothetical protein
MSDLPVPDLRTVRWNQVQAELREARAEVQRLREENEWQRERLLWIVNVAATEAQYKQVAREALDLSARTSSPSTPTSSTGTP